MQHENVLERVCVVDVITFFRDGVARRNDGASGFDAPCVDFWNASGMIPHGRLV